MCVFSPIYVYSGGSASNYSGTATPNYPTEVCHTAILNEMTFQLNIVIFISLLMAMLLYGFYRSQFER